MYPTNIFLLFNIQLEKGLEVKLPHFWIHALAAELYDQSSPNEYFCIGSKAKQFHKESETTSPE